MAQRSTHKGPRAQVMAPVAAVVYASIQELAEVHATSFNQAAADFSRPGPVIRTLYE